MSRQVAVDALANATDRDLGFALDNLERFATLDQDADSRDSISQSLGQCSLAGDEDDCATRLRLMSANDLRQKSRENVPPLTLELRIEVI